MQACIHSVKILHLQGKGPGGMLEAPITKADSGTQTDTHFMETNIVKTYEWNEWELRRKAMKLVKYHPPFLISCLKRH